jgi:hypothetical protein
VRALFTSTPALHLGPVNIYYIYPLNIAHELSCFFPSLCVIAQPKKLHSLSGGEQKERKPLSVFLFFIIIAEADLNLLLKGAHTQ